MRYGKNFCTAGKRWNPVFSRRRNFFVSWDEVQGQQKEQKETVEKLQQEASFYAEQAESAKNEIIEILNRRASTKGKLQRYDAMLEQIQIRKAELASRQLQMKGDENRQTETLKNYQAEYEAVSRKMEESGEEYRKIEQQAAELKKEIDEQHRQLEAGQTAYHREASRLESLKILQSGTWLRKQHPAYYGAERQKSGNTGRGGRSDQDAEKV